jgi:hypothetical protein
MTYRDGLSVPTDLSSGLASEMLPEGRLGCVRWLVSLVKHPVVEGSEPGCQPPSGPFSRATATQRPSVPSVQFSPGRPAQEGVKSRISLAIQGPSCLSIAIQPILISP